MTRLVAGACSITLVFALEAQEHKRPITLEDVRDDVVSDAPARISDEAASMHVYKTMIEFWERNLWLPMSHDAGIILRL